MDDIRLVEGLKKGDEESFKVLLDRYEGRIFNTALRITGDFSETEDVVQEAFLKAYRNIDSFDFRSGFYTWLYRIAVNSALDSRKKTMKHRALSLNQGEDVNIDIPADGEDPTRNPEMDEMAELLSAALDELPEKYRTILVLREYEGLSYIEISEVLNCSKGTVESRLFRARERLKKKMEKYL